MSALASAVGSIFDGFVFVIYSRRTLLTLILFIARGIIAGVFQAAYVYTPEVILTL